VPALSRIDLAQMARERGRKRDLTLRPIEPTGVLENELARIYLRVVREWRRIIAELVLPAFVVTAERMTQDDTTGATRHAGQVAEGEALRIVAEARTAARGWAVRVEKWHTGKWVSTVESGTGVKVAGVVLSEDAADQVAIALERNAALIKGISDDLQKQVETKTWQAVANQTPRLQLAKDLQETLDIGRRRAINIARDQTNKLAGDLDRMRQQQAGITQYEWRHSGKLHFRPEHKARDGKIFDWDDPPDDGHPRTQPNCGCTAKAMLSIED
jgi:SPP1 gp7 family putative phage head morphogenesis protein